MISMIDAARDLGANNFQVLSNIILPKPLYCEFFYALLTLSGMLNQNTINLLLLAVLFGTFFYYTKQNSE